MKRFLDNKIVTAQESRNFGESVTTLLGGVLKPLIDPNSNEGKLANTIGNLTDKQKSEVKNKVIDNLGKIESNRVQAQSVFKQNGQDEEEYSDFVENVFKGFGIPEFQTNQYIIGLWPLMRDKNFTFLAFKSLLIKVLKRFTGPAQIENFFKTFSTAFPNLENTIGTSDEAIQKVIDFLASGKSAKEFQDFLLYQMILSYGLYNKIPENKKADILKVSEQIETLRSPITKNEQEYLNFLREKGNFLREKNKFYTEVALAIMDMEKENFSNLIGVFRKGIDFNSIRIYLENFQRGSFFDELIKSTPFSPDSQNADVEGTKVGTSFVQSKRKIFASADTRSEIDKATGTVKKEAVPPPPPQTETTESGDFSRLYGKFIVQIQEFESTTQNLARKVDEEIAYIVNKQSTKSPQIGPFSAGNVFQYLQNEQESLDESDKVIALIETIIASSSNLKTSLIDVIDNTVLTLPDQNALRQKETAKTAIREKFDIFKKDMRSQQLGLKFNKILIARQNEYSEAQDLYDDLKIEMESNVSIRPVMAPKAILAGFKMADILEEIAEEFKQIAAENPIRTEQAMKTARRWENFAKQQRALVFTEIYPGMAQSIGIEATKPSISPSFSLSRAALNIVKNLRFASKFMDKEVESDKKFRDYWNNLFMQSKDPRPMGDIIEEKPKHGNLTTEEDAKLHKDTMRKFKKPVSKKSRFKKK